MPKCRTCGNPIQATARICRRCGALTGVGMPAKEEPAILSWLAFLLIYVAVAVFLLLTEWLLP
ncbi:zinc-ribbon domain-containing protein [Methylobacterium sp. CM6257]|jgi:predicted nucleic acid-binding Zn ribbon protein